MTTGERLRELYAYRLLVLNLTARDIRLKYKGSVLGVAWSMLNPLVMMLIYTAVFSVFLRVVSVPHYWAFIVVGLVAWVFISNALTSATISFIRTSSLITKVYFPVESLPIANVLAHFFNLLVSMAVVIAVLLVARIPIGPPILLLPVILLALLLAAVGTGLLLASLTVHFRDLEHVIVLVMTAWFYVTPVLYPLDPRALPPGAAKYIGLAEINPLSWYLESLHSVVFFDRLPDPLLFTLMLVSAVLLPVLGYLVFTRVRGRLPEEV